MFFKLACRRCSTPATLVTYRLVTRWTSIVLLQVQISNSRKYCAEALSLPSATAMAAPKVKAVGSLLSACLALLSWAVASSLMILGAVVCSDDPRIACCVPTMARLAQTLKDMSTLHCRPQGCHGRSRLSLPTHADCRRAVCLSAGRWGRMCWTFEESRTCKERRQAI